MRPASFLLPLALTASQVIARLTPVRVPAERGLLDSPGVLDNVLLFDAPAFPDPNNSANTIAAFQTYVSLRSPDLGVVTAAVTTFLSSLGVTVGDSLNTLQDRVKLIASIGIPGKTVQITVSGCSATAKLPSTSISDLGLASGQVSLGSCTAAEVLQATVVPGLLDSRRFVASVFPSPNSGFGVLSDIDDTIKITNVLDKVELLKNTLLNAPEPVANMPELYIALSKSLQDPQFLYVTGSPYQLYPFLSQFINTTYASAKGPVFTQNLTIVDPAEVIEFFANSDATVFDHKVSTIDRIYTMYPQKQWLAIGDSTQKDPEVYASIFKKYPGFITCIWIRRVDGAANSDERFATAFADVPADKRRVFNDSETISLASIDVAGGKC